MLVLSRKVGEKIVLSGGITIVICEVESDNSVSIGIEAPKSVKILRSELVDAVAETNRDALTHTEEMSDAALERLMGRVKVPR